MSMQCKAVCVITACNGMEPIGQEVNHSAALTVVAFGSTATAEKLWLQVRAQVLCCLLDNRPVAPVVFRDSGVIDYLLLGGALAVAGHQRKNVLESDTINAQATPRLAYTHQQHAGGSSHGGE